MSKSSLIRITVDSAALERWEDEGGRVTSPEELARTGQGDAWAVPKAAQQRVEALPGLAPGLEGRQLGA